MTTRKRKTHKARPSTSRGKGDILEEIVASMHGFPGAKVERNVFLPALHAPERQREIDVLISGTVGGYPVKVGIECKNVRSPVGPKLIGEFADKLDDVGLPIRQGVFITASRFTSGALSRAKDLGIQTLEYRNVADKLPAAISNAVQSVIFLMLTISQIRITNNKGGPAQWGEILFFRGEDGTLKGSVPDLVWRQWRLGRLEESLGDHTVDLDLPSGWLQIVDGERADVEKMEVGYSISAHVVDFPGRLAHHQLLDSRSGTVSKFQVDATFDPKAVRYPVSAYANEGDLESALKARKASVKLQVGRVRLPRVRWGSMYWPPSQQAMQKLMALFILSRQKGEEFNLADIRIEDIEGEDLTTLWDPIIPDHPMASGE